MFKKVTLSKRWPVKEPPSYIKQQNHNPFSERVNTEKEEEEEREMAACIDLSRIPHIPGLSHSFFLSPNLFVSFITFVLQMKRRIFLILGESKVSIFTLFLNSLLCLLCFTALYSVSVSPSTLSQQTRCSLLCGGSLGFTGSLVIRRHLLSLRHVSTGL